MTVREQVHDFVSDESIPVSARFAVQRLDEAMTRSTPLVFSASAHNDPRVLLRDLTAAIDWMNAPGPKRQPWALLIPRLRRVRALIKHDQAMRRWFPAESNAFLTAYAVLPGNPQIPDWAPASAGLTTASRALRDAMLHQTAGYRPTLTATVGVAFRGKVVSPQALRRLDERLGLLAAMLVDEGRDRDEVLGGLIRALRQSPSHNWERVARDALSGGWLEYRVAVAATGFVCGAWDPAGVPDALPTRLAAAWRLLRDGWPPQAIGRLVVEARLAGADTLVLTRTHARDPVHAVRLGRLLANRAADHQATTATNRDVRVLSPTAVRQRGSSSTTLTRRPRRSNAGPPVKHPPVAVAGAMSYLRRATGSESDVDRVLNGWIAIESLGRGRGGTTAQNVVAKEMPDLAWLLAARATFVASYEHLAAVARQDTDWPLVVSHVQRDAAGWEGRWLDLLAGTAPVAAQGALGRVLGRCTPLPAWRVREAGERLLNGRLLVQQLNRHRTEVEWVVGRLREARNTVAHNAMIDVQQMSVGRALGRGHQLPTDARFLGRAAVALLSEIGAVTATRMTGQPGQLSNFESYLARSRSFVLAIERRAKSAPRGTRFQANAPSLP